MISKVLNRYVLAVFAGALTVFLVGACGSAGKAKLPAAAKNPDVVAVYDGTILTLNEFESRYARTVGSREAAEDDSLSEYRDFLERYVNFRLKVLAAEEAGVDESPEVAQEIRTYRANLARPYLLENEVIEPVVRELYERQKQLNDVSHVLIRVDQFAEPADTLEAYRRASALRDSVLQGQDFGEIAFLYSEDPSARGPETRLGHQGRLGYFSAGRMVEPFETWSYTTPVGEVSPVFRTQFGYHFIYVHDRRPAVPDIQLSHIMVRPQPNDSSAAMDTLQVVQKRLEAGEDFAELASQYSIDMQSRPRGGDIGFISFDAPIHESFKNPAFALKEIGDVSDIVETPYGLHIIKLTGRNAPKSFEEAYEELKQTASRLPRIQEAERDLARKVIIERGAKVDTSLVFNTFGSVEADSVYSLLIGKRAPDAVLTAPLFVIGDSSYTIADLAEFASNERLEHLGDTEFRLMKVLTNFLTSRTIEYEAARLEERDPEFSRIMEEFRDGLVLFQFMEDSVWTAAERDSLALRAHYDAHAQEYRWPERTRIISIEASSDSLATLLAHRLDAGESPADIQAAYDADTLNTIRVDTMLIAEKTNSIYDRALELAEGRHTSPLKYRNSYVVLLNDGKEAPRQKTFEEARTQVVSEYQSILEERLIARLRERYNAHTFPERLVNAFDEAPEPTQASATGG